MSEVSLVLSSSFTITLATVGRLFPSLLRQVFFMGMIWGWMDRFKDFMAKVFIIWVSKMKIKLKISFSIVHFEIKGGLAGSPGPYFDYFMEAS